MTTIVYPVCYTSDNGSIIKHKELIGRNIQSLCDGKEGVQGDGFFDIGSFDMTDKCCGAVDLLGQRLLGKALQLAVVCDFQPKLQVFFVKLLVHVITSYCVHFTKGRQ